MSKYIDLVCGYCNKVFKRELRYFKYESKRCGENYTPLCSRECVFNHKRTKMEITCDCCSKSFLKFLNQIKKSSHNFCSTNCSAIFNNQQRKLSVNIKEINCKYCDSIFAVNKESSKKVCSSCKSKRKEELAKAHVVFSNCLLCGIELQSKYYTKKKYCDSCRHIFRQELGKRIGKLSAAIQVRRSKNEINFAELCQQAYKNVTTNEPFFDSKYGKWDADVIIHEHKIAILWNGVWHYKQVRRGHYLKQVQSRDKIKLDVIKNNGYISYIIRDDGKFNKKFVDEQFELFQAFLKESK